MKPCNQCGRCCTKYSNGGLSATSDEIEYWQTFRPTIAKFAAFGEIWIDPSTGQQFEICPWLRKAVDAELYTCDIYHDRPDDCRVYPTSVDQMILDDCEMIEQKDRDNRKQAQAALAVIMSDSWPS